MSIRDEIVRVYKRKVKDHPEGAVVHMGDCGIYNAHLGVCTCGLGHWLLQMGEGAEELYPKFFTEESNEGLIDYMLQEFKQGNLYTKRGDDFMFDKVERPEPISEENFKNIMDKLMQRKKKNDE